MKYYYGVGINDCGHPVAKTCLVNGKRKNIWLCPYNQTWKTMLQRCYSKTYRQNNNYYKGCTVDEKWHKLSNFEAWVKDQPYHDEWLKGENIHLDKDFLVPNNRVYGPDTCILIPAYVNSCLSLGPAENKTYPGVSPHRHKFQVKICTPEGRKHLGLFDTEEEAFLVWKKEKIVHLGDVLKKYTGEGKYDSRVVNVINLKIKEWERK